MAATQAQLPKGRVTPLRGSALSLRGSYLLAARNGRDEDLVCEDRRRLADPDFVLHGGRFRRVPFVHAFLGCV